ncbi:conserved hypothetical protein [Alteracholeplasma palmae J233]|uniref:GNAT family acetyltransferase n=1 Tax=Alteracholeplasma palmae (strain ATCC 49389 / J233) TaxID=1318466 RepID=U4KLC2_ALTPJ|nr:hypothetical protein [Alteracholeplasma palmae]CCV64607.1 conserved hypothetical protein [Alteracholeplasma palmae J233]
MEIQLIDYTKLKTEYKIAYRKYRKYYEITKSNQIIGCFAAYENEFHSKHMYIQPDFKFDEKVDSKSIFSYIKKYFKKPLQIMIDSIELEIIHKIEHAGFILKRKCYEREFTKDKLKNLIVEKDNLRYAQKESKVYLEFSEKYYLYYKKTHEGISPLTAEKIDFYMNLPERIIYDEQNNVCFIKESEIYYVLGHDERSFVQFIRQVLDYLYKQYDTVCFEADNTDPYATLLKNLFTDTDNTSFNTYILD